MAGLGKRVIPLVAFAKVILWKRCSQHFPLYVGSFDKFKSIERRLSLNLSEFEIEEYATT